MLKEKKCIPCEGGVPPLTLKQINEMMSELNDWSLENRYLVKDYEFSDFKSALEFVNKVGKLSEEEAHHPEISFGWGRARIELWTHAINGLSENDFILAAKIDSLSQ